MENISDAITWRDGTEEHRARALDFIAKFFNPPEGRERPNYNMLYDFHLFTSKRGSIRDLKAAQDDKTIQAIKNKTATVEKVEISPANGEPRSVKVIIRSPEGSAEFYIEGKALKDYLTGQ